MRSRDGPGIKRARLVKRRIRSHDKDILWNRSQGAEHEGSLKETCRRGSQKLPEAIAAAVCGRGVCAQGRCRVSNVDL